MPRFSLLHVSHDRPPLVSTGRSYRIDTDGEYVTAPDATPNHPLVTANTNALTSKARHIAARSSGKETYMHGGIQPLVIPNAPLVVR